MNDDMKKIFIPIFASALLLASCSDWTKPESLQYRPLSPEEQDPDAYAKALAAVKEYKQTKHDIMIVTMKGTSETPVARPQHLMNMPDSADIICVKNAAGLHPSLVAEISQVLETKGTRSLVFVDYNAIDEAWTALEDAKSDNGQPAGTAAEAEEYFRTQAEAQIAACGKYGFAGLVVSYEGNTATEILAAKQKGFLSAATQWRNDNKDAILIVRGSIRNINYSSYKDFIDSAMYLTVLADETSAPGQLNLLVPRVIGYYAPTDRVIMEVSVPSADTPEQKGATPQVAAQWVLDEKENKNFTPRGVCVGNADDDYYRQDMIYSNIRQAISIMNPAGAE